MKTYQFKIPGRDFVWCITAKGFTQKGAYRRACREVERYESKGE